MIIRLGQGAALALALAASTQANAGVTIYGTYYDEFITNTCVTASSCRVNFSAIPSDKLLMVSKVNCTIYTAAPVTDLSLRISTTNNGQTLFNRLLPMAIALPQVVGSGPALYVTSVREETHFLIGQGRFPVVVAFATGPATITMNCTIMGDLVTPIQ